MNRKIIYVLIGIFAVLLLVSYIQRSFERATGKPETLNQLSLSFEPEKVTKIDVFKQDYPDSGLHFLKRDTVWVVTNEYSAPAKGSDVRKLIDDLHAISGTVRGESADLFSNFDITDEKALQIEFHDSDNNKVLHIYVGKGGGTGRESFVRLAGSPITYLADENFISRFAAWNAPPEKKLPTDRWLELKLCEFDKNNIESIKINKGKTIFEFVNQETPSEDTLSPPQKVWKQISPEKGTRLDENKIKSLSAGIAGLRGKGVVDPANGEKFGLDKPKSIVWIGDNSGKGIEIDVGDPVNKDEDRYVVIKGRGTVYNIDKGTFERIFVKPFEGAK